MLAAGEAPRNSGVRLDGVVIEGARFDFALEAGEQLVTLADGGAERLLAMVLKRHVVPDRGLVMVGGADMATFDMYLLRSEVTVLDRPTIVEVTIREYLAMASADVTSKRCCKPSTRWACARASPRCRKAWTPGLPRPGSRCGSARSWR